jgi:hypothetical protein
MVHVWYLKNNCPPHFAWLYRISLMSSLTTKNHSVLCHGHGWKLSLDHKLGCTHRQSYIKSVIQCVFVTIYFTPRNYTEYVDKNVQTYRRTTWCWKHVDYDNGFIKLLHVSLAIYLFWNPFLYPCTRNGIKLRTIIFWVCWPSQCPTLDYLRERVIRNWFCY